MVFRNTPITEAYTLLEDFSSRNPDEYIATSYSQIENFQPELLVYLEYFQGTKPVSDERTFRIGASLCWQLLPEEEKVDRLALDTLKASKSIVTSKANLLNDLKWMDERTISKNFTFYSWLMGCTYVYKDPRDLITGASLLSLPFFIRKETRSTLDCLELPVNWSRSTST